MVDRDGDPPLEPGTWYVDVFDPYGLDPVPFTVHVSFDALPAPALLALPRLPPPGEGIDRALRATVELLTSEGGGSGTLISPDGWVLTNHHVIELLGTEQPVAEGQVVIGFSFDERSPPVETFRGSVVVSDAELDLALVKIETGLYGQPLPAGFSFPYLELGDTDRVKIGDSVSLLGFPTLGGMGSRATVSLTRGVISGFDTALGGLMFKTDAEIGSGNSGGAALDAAWRLVGVPVAVREEVEGYSQLGYILPVSRMSPDWRALVGD
jgi:S1-C subfamily serine protease